MKDWYMPGDNQTKEEQIEEKLMNKIEMLEYEIMRERDKNEALENRIKKLEKILKKGVDKTTNPVI